MELVPRHDQDFSPYTVNFLLELAPVSDEFIFRAVLAITDPAQRAAYLDQACADNLELRRAIEARLTVAATEQTLPLPAVDPGQMGTYLHADGALTQTGASRASGTAEGGALSAGEQIGPYRLLEKIGEGGMGVVYKARHDSLKRLVALKMIRMASCGEREHQRFAAEVEAVARLQHPNIIGIYEVGEIHGQPFCALEYLEGGSLDSRIAGHILPPRKAARLMENLARATQAIHQLQLVHRDLKPSNILLQGRPDDPVEHCTLKICDFGLAKMLDDETAAGLTREGAVMGTPFYMAPEQAAGRTTGIDHRADIYSLGAILYEMLTGQPPLKGSSLSETLWKVIHEEPASPRRLVQGVDRDLEIICLKCLDKEPDRRFNSALELADELERYLNEEPIRTRQVGWIEYGVKWIRRHPAGAAAWLLALMVAVLGSAGSFASWQWLQAESARAQAVVSHAQAEEARKQAEKANAGLAQQKRLADEAKGWALRDRLRFEQALAKAQAPSTDVER